jgi:hypothetical protein
VLYITWRITLALWFECVSSSRLLSRISYIIQPKHARTHARTFVLRSWLVGVSLFRGRLERAWDGVLCLSCEPACTYFVNHSRITRSASSARTNESTQILSVLVADCGHCCPKMSNENVVVSSCKQFRQIWDAFYLSLLILIMLLDE